MGNKIKILLLIMVISTIKPETVNYYVNQMEELIEKMSSYEYTDRYNEFYRNSFQDKGLYGTYDFIIIGAGSAGTLLANRLSKVSQWSVLLLEAGQNDSLVTDVPGLAPLLQFTDFNWGYRSISQKNCCLGMNDQKCVLPRGKVLGGSSTINYMVYTRGNKEDYNNWAEEGNLGWSYEEVLPYFKKFEKSLLTENVDEEFRNKYGDLSVNHVKNFDDLDESVLKAYEELGQNILDYNGRNQLGASPLQMNTESGRRCSGNKAFLSKVTDRKNLKVLTGAFVTKLLLNKSNDGVTVEAVEFVLGDEKYTAETKKEIILSAGAVGSPQILMLSGVGPKQHLESLGINTFLDLSVGKNLGDHVLITQPVFSNYTNPDLKPLDEMFQDYLSHKGYFTVVGLMKTISFVNFNNKNNNSDIEYLLGTFNFEDGFFQKGMGITEQIHSSYFKPYGVIQPTLFIILLHPKSRGSIKLKSDDPFDHPLIDVNYFSHPDDLDTFVKGMRQAFRFIQTKTFKKFDFKLLHNPISECTEEFMSDNYLKCLIRHIATTVYHYFGTCKMGPATDPQSVVDERLKVRGVKNLRVIDASIMPTPVGGHTNIPVFMIAEKGSDMIKQDWGVPFYCKNKCLNFKLSN